MQRSRRFWFGLCRSFLASYLFAFSPLAAETAAQEQFSESSRAAQPAVSFDGLIQYLHGVRDSDSDAMLIKVIERFGLAFRPTPDQLSRLRNSAASYTLLKAIEIARRPAPPPAPPEDSAVSITCAPVDCDLWVNDAPAGRTTGTLRPWLKLRPGPVTLVASAPHYDSPESRRQLVLAPGERRNIAFTFEPSPAYLTEWGEQLFKRMIQAMGSPVSTQPGSVRAAGTLYVREGEGRLTAWSIAVWIRGAELVRLDASRLNERYTFPKSAAHAKRSAAAKMPPQLAAAATLLSTALLQRQIQLLTAPGVAVEAREPENRVLRVRGAAGKYLVTLDEAFRPSRIEVEGEARAEGAAYLYSEYSEFDGLPWPGLVQATGSASRLAIEARFTDLQHSDEPAGRSSGVPR